MAKDYSAKTESNVILGKQTAYAVVYDDKICDAYFTTYQMVLSCARARAKELGAGVQIWKFMKSVGEEG